MEALLQTHAAAFRDASTRSKAAIPLSLMNAIESFLDCTFPQPEEPASLASLESLVTAVKSTAWEVANALAFPPKSSDSDSDPDSDVPLHEVSRLWHVLLSCLMARDATVAFAVFRTSDSFTQPTLADVGDFPIEEIADAFAPDEETSLRRQIREAEQEVDEKLRAAEEARKENEDLNGRLEELRMDWKIAQQERARVTQADEELKQDVADHREEANRVSKEWKMGSDGIGMIISWAAQFEAEFVPGADGSLARELLDAVNSTLREPDGDHVKVIRDVFDAHLKN